MAWQSRVTKTNSKPERQMRGILQEMKDAHHIQTFISNQWIQAPFRRKGFQLEADFLVDDVLVIEVQGSYFHLKKTRANKDVAKRHVFEHMGLGVLWVWDDELKYACQKRRGPIWRQYLKNIITIKLYMAENNREAYKMFLNALEFDYSIRMPHPDLGDITIRGRRD